MNILDFSIKTWKICGFIEDNNSNKRKLLLNGICQTLLYVGIPLYFLSCSWFFVDIYVYKNEMDIEPFLYIVMQAIGALCYFGTLIDFLKNKKNLKNVINEIQYTVDLSKYPLSKQLFQLIYFATFSE